MVSGAREGARAGTGLAAMGAWAGSRACCAGMRFATSPACRTRALAARREEPACPLPRSNAPALLARVAAEANAVEAQAAFDGMAADGVAPTRLHHQQLLAAYSAAGDLTVRAWFSAAGRVELAGRRGGLAGSGPAPQPAAACLHGQAAAPCRLAHPPLLCSTAGRPPSALPRLPACPPARLQGVDAAYRGMQAAGFEPNSATFRLLFDTVRHWAELDGAWPASQPAVLRTCRARARRATLARAHCSTRLPACLPRPCRSGGARAGGRDVQHDRRQ